MINDGSGCLRQVRKRTTAITTTQIRKTTMLMRSQSPTHGVGRFAATREVFEDVKVPNARRITIVAIE